MTAGRRRGMGAASPSLRVETLLTLACGLLVAGYAVLLATAWLHGSWVVDHRGAPAPADFNAFWAAARVASAGRAADAYGWTALERALAQAGRAADPTLEFPFYYPPVFLLWLKPIGALGYAPAELAWVAVTGAAYLAATRLAGGGRLAGLLAAASPAAFACVYVGQSGLLTAALAAGGLALLPRRPLLAGVCIGLLGYKPQFGPALPILLLAGAHWRTIAAAAATLLASYVAAGLLLGWDAYARCFEAMRDHGASVLLLQLRPEQLQSVYGVLRTLHAPMPAVWAAQGVAALAVVALTARLWAKRAPWALQAGAAAATMLVASPYALLYDYPLLAVAAAFLLADGRRAPLTRADAAGLALAFSAPFASAALALPLCPAGAAAALAVALVRGERCITKVSSAAAHPIVPAPASLSTTGD